MDRSRTAETVAAATARLLDFFGTDAAIGARAGEDDADGALARRFICRGCHGFELWPELEVQEKDLIVHKTRFGAFVPGSSGLHDIMQARGIDTLIITGTATNVCCESTARDAMRMNYKVILVADGNATNTDAEHDPDRPR